MEIKVKCFEDIKDIMEAARIGDMQSLNMQAKIVDETPELVAYNIRRKFLSEISTLPDSTVGGKVRQELKQNGIALLFNEDERTVEIDQFDDVWTALNGAEATEVNEANEVVEANEVAVSDEVSDSEIPVLENTEDGITQEIAQEVSEEAAEEATEESIEEVESAEANENDVNDEDNENDVSETGDAVEADESASEPDWDVAIILFNAIELNTQTLYDKAVEAGQYKVSLGKIEQRDSLTDIDESAGSSERTDAIPERADEIEGADYADDAEDTGSTVNTENNIEDSTESIIDENEGSNSEVAEVVADNADDIATSSFDLAYFLIQNIFACDVFMINSSSSSARTASIRSGVYNTDGAINSSLIIGKTLYLASRSKGIAATGVMISEKRILVKAGSTISTENRLPNQKGQTSSANLRQKLIDDGVVVDERFVADYEFNSTSAAASVILGQSASGMNTWKDEAGRKLESLLGR